MRLTRGAGYGARGIICLAKRPPNAVALVSEIASIENLPESYLAKIFQDLGKCGLVRSHRGAKGGFSLARPAGEITLREIIEAIEGPILLNRCLAPWEGCERVDTCGLYPVLKKAQEQLLQMLEATTLADLVRAETVAAE